MHELVSHNTDLVYFTETTYAKCPDYFFFLCFRSSGGYEGGSYRDSYDSYGMHPKF